MSVFKKHLNEIAEKLSAEKGQALRTRFNPDLQCAELHVPFGEVVARVKVNGEMCSPTTAVITLLSISESAKELFVKILPLHVKFEAAAA